jgi:hypothetical protein
MTEPPKRKFPVVPVAVFVVILIGGLIFLLQNDGDSPDDRNPYKYDISQYETVPEGMLKWHEVSTDTIKLDGIPSALAVGPAGIVVAVENNLMVYPEKRVLATTAKPARALVYHSDGRLFAAFNDHVEVFGADGKRLASWTTLGEKAQLTSMAFYSGKLFICDSGTLCVWRFSDDGALEKQFSGPKGMFVVPSPYFDVAPSKEGLWIVNPGVHHIGLYDVDFKPIRSIGKTGMGPGEFSGCCNPSHIAVAADGSIVALEKGMPRVRVFEATGDLREFVASAKVISSSYPVTDIALSGDGRVLLLDRVQKAVRVFARDAANKTEGDHD